MSKEDTPQADEVYKLTDEQIANLRQAGLSEYQINSLPDVRGLDSRQLDIAELIGMFPHYEGELSDEELAALPDDQIDLSDMPELTDEIWANVVLVKAKPVKEQVTIRLDPDVLEHFHKRGADHETYINAVLWLWMKTHPHF
jgi:uncharacterized protein (DUF4415 family)